MFFKFLAGYNRWKTTSYKDRNTMFKSFADFSHWETVWYTPIICVSLVSWPLSPWSRFVNYNPKDGPSSSPKQGICVLYIYVSIYMYTNITKWFVEQTFDFLLGSYVDHIWHAHKAKSRISLVDTIDGKACCPINGMRGTSPHSPISWQTANVKNPCAIETCSYMYRIKRNIYIGFCTQHVHPQCES